MTDRASQTVLTTGANSGIGLATTIELARRGYHSVGSVRSEAKAEVVHEAAAEAGVEVETVLLDVTDPAQCEQAVAGSPPTVRPGQQRRLRAHRRHRGRRRRRGPPPVRDDGATRRCAWPGSRSRACGSGGGRIVNISSIAGLTTAPFAGWYTGAKHALEALSDALRIEVAGDGVKVVLVEPGGFKTGIWEEFERDIERRETDGSRNAAAYRRSLQAQRLIEPIMGSPERLRRVDRHGSTSSVPRNRYLVGIDAQAMLLADRLTPHLREGPGDPPRARPLIRDVPRPRPVAFGPWRPRRTGTRSCATSSPSPTGAELQAFVADERATHQVYPPPDEVFAALHHTPYADGRRC